MTATATGNAGDVRIEIAAAALPGILSVSADQDIPNQYFALEQAVDTAGLPTTINWTTVPCRSTSGATLSGCDDHSLYRIQYVIDRLCSALPGADTRANCVAQDPKDNSSKKSNSPVFTTATKIYYRATVRVQGPRNATSIIQGTLGY